MDTFNEYNYTMKKLIGDAVSDACDMIHDMQGDPDSSYPNTLESVFEQALIFVALSLDPLTGDGPISENLKKAIHEFVFSNVKFAVVENSY